jgi:hypothetical protein
MDIAALVTSSVAATGVKQEVGFEVLKRAEQIAASTTAQLINSVAAPPNLPAHLGNTINTTA